MLLAIPLGSAWGEGFEVKDPADRERGIYSEDEIEALASVMTTTLAEDRRAAIYEARRLAGEDKIENLLLEFLNGKHSTESDAKGHQNWDKDLRPAAAISLGKMKVQRALPQLGRLLKDKSDWMRETAAYALGEIGDRKALEALEKTIPTNGEAFNWLVKEAIEKIKGSHPRGNTKPVRRSLSRSRVLFLGSQIPSKDSLDFTWPDTMKAYELQYEAFGPADLDLDDKIAGHGGLSQETKNQLMTRTEYKSGRPQVDIIVITNLACFEFPRELRWKLWNWVRRGGKLVFASHNVFHPVRGRDVVKQKVVIDDRWRRGIFDSALPDALTKKFYPFLPELDSESRQKLLIGHQPFERGQVIILSWLEMEKLSQLIELDIGNKDLRPNIRSEVQLGDHFVGALLKWVSEGDSAFPAVLDRPVLPARIRAGETLNFQVPVFHDGQSSSYKLHVEVTQRNEAGQSILEKTVQVKMDDRKSGDVQVNLPFPTFAPHGPALITFRLFRPDSEAPVSIIEHPFELEGNLSVRWSAPSGYEGSVPRLEGKIWIENRAATGPMAKWC